MERLRKNRLAMLETLQERLRDLWADIHESCAGKQWAGRLIFWFWLAYITVNHCRDEGYQSIFGGLNLGIHEFGHLICQPFGQFIAILGGSLVQCLVPVISFLMFWRQRDFFAWTFSLVWLGTNLHYVSHYIADARKLELELVSPFGGDGEVIHDWNWLLNDMNLLTHEQEIALAVRVLGIVVSLVGLGWGGVMMWLMFRSAKKDELRMP